MTESMGGSPGGSKGVGFTNWLVSKAAGVLERKSSRRGFILGSAMVGSAVAVAGCAPGTQPGTPYSHITDCAGGLCADGYTEFCCTINNGINACPPGTFVAGWWRADYSSFCNGTRYYMDCNESCCGPNLGNGFCARPVGLDCHFESICESCTFFQTTIEFRPTLQAQRDDAAEKGQLGRQKVFDGLLARLGDAAS